ncbi:hypothetical protein C9374_009486 [Naegleria lovaniensis]|uniref:Sodium/calcium exchanger membrane region domain-containing protein n=1 Tax=Naegleria lovaniensis TaxID=51637 RepID=A0AA88GYH9_NAELO|nr:uncharacterized protein C9374_009486 [Naegleria lovaniensis]KAG2392909.1 hypothetical protein C9374_009486 [Naegleria lovaniensis]
MILMGSVVIPSIKKYGLWNGMMSFITSDSRDQPPLTMIRPLHDRELIPQLHPIPSLHGPLDVVVDNSTDINNSTDNNPYASYFLAINASKSCEFSSVPSNLSCFYLNWNGSGCDADNRYLQMVECTALHDAQPVFYIFAVVLILVCFYLLGDTAETYFSPALIKISQYLRMSPNLAGITLLALGNGAPDLSSIIVGMFNGNVDFGVGEPIGAGMFVTSVVMGSVALFSNVRGIARRPFLRDAIFYLVSVSYTFYLYIDGRVYIWEAILCLIIYVAYVTTVIVGRIIYKRLKKRKEAKQQKELTRTKGVKLELKDSLIPNRRDPEEYQDASMTSPQENNGSENAGATPSTPSEAITTPDSTFGPVVEEEGESDEEEYVGWTKTIARDAQFKEITRAEGNKIQSRFFVPKIGIVDFKKKDAEKQSQNNYVITDYFHKDNEEHTSSQYYKVQDQTEAVPTEEIAQEDQDQEPEETKFKRYVNKFVESIEWNDKKWYHKIWFIFVEWYWILLRNITIPKSEETDWNKWFAMCIPIFSPLVLLVCAGYDKFIYLINDAFPVAVLLVMIGSILSIVIFFTSRRKKPPKYMPLFVVYAFVLCTAWIYLVANELLLVLEALGTVIGIPTSVLAITVLSWGNSLSDMIADVVVSRQGYPSMALGAVFGGPMLNLLIGLFVALTFAPAQLTKLCFSLDSDPTVNLSFIFLIVSLLSSIIVIPILKFRAPKAFGVYMYCLYVVYLVMALLSALFPPVQKAFTWRGDDLC